MSVGILRRPELSARARWWHWLIVAAPLLPIAANSFGWIFTEIGRQPWVVNHLMVTRVGVSPSVSATEVAISLFIIRYDPSPTSTTTSRFGRASFAPRPPAIS